MERIKVLIADDEDTVLDVLDALISAESDLEVVGAAKDAETAIELASRERPDIALLDVRMPGGGGMRAAREIARRSPPTKLIALSAHEDVESVLGMLRAGALGYVVKSESTERILTAIRRSLDEQATLSPRVTTDVAHALGEQLHRLSPGPKRRRQQAERIRRVLDEDALAMEFQPIVDLENGSVVGMEALARFEALPRRSPDAWFAEAQAAGMPVELELAAVGRALAHLDQLPPSVYLSLNVSPGTIAAPELVERLEGVPPERLVLEITEHAQVDDYSALNGSVARLRASGIRLAIDDAGAGFASLRHIVLLLPDIIKLDVTLTSGVERDEARRALVAALVSFGSQIGADVIAEGVETLEQIETLHAEGVRFAQGFLLARPGPLPTRDDISSPEPL